MFSITLTLLRCMDIKIQQTINRGFWTGTLFVVKEQLFPSHFQKSNNSKITTQTQSSQTYTEILELNSNTKVTLITIYNKKLTYAGVLCSVIMYITWSELISLLALVIGDSKFWVMADTFPISSIIDLKLFLKLSKYRKIHMSIKYII